MDCQTRYLETGLFGKITLRRMGLEQFDHTS